MADTASNTRSRMRRLARKRPGLLFTRPVPAVIATAFAILVSVAANHVHVVPDEDEACAVCIAFAGKSHLTVDYIEANLHRGLSIADIAGHVTMSESHFSHAFRQTGGVPPHRFVRDRRVERAKALLRECELPLSEIA